MFAYRVSQKNRDRRCESTSIAVKETIQSQPPQLPLGCATTRYGGLPAAA